MNRNILFVTAVFAFGVIIGVFSSNLPLATAAAESERVAPDEVTFVVSIDEVAKNFVFAEQFSSSYEKTVTMSDGSERSIVLTPM